MKVGGMKGTAPTPAGAAIERRGDRRDRKEIRQGENLSWHPQSSCRSAEKRKYSSFAPQDGLPGPDLALEAGPDLAETRYVLGGLAGRRAGLDRQVTTE